MFNNAYIYHHITYIYIYLYFIKYTYLYIYIYVSGFNFTAKLNCPAIATPTLLNLLKCCEPHLRFLGWTTMYRIPEDTVYPLGPGPQRPQGKSTWQATSIRSLHQGAARSVRPGWCVESWGVASKFDIMGYTIEYYIYIYISCNVCMYVM